MIRVKRVGRCVIHGMFVSGWWLEGEDEALYGDYNQVGSQAFLILLAAIFVHQAGYAGFELVDGFARPECFEVARVTHDAIAKARGRPRSRQGLRAWLIRRLGGTP